MPTLFESSETGFGDVILNFGDRLYANSPERAVHDNVLRLCAYLLFAERVGLPTRHVLQNSKVFAILKWVPELLQDGVVFVDIPRGSTSVVGSASLTDYADDPGDEVLFCERAAFLDQNSKALHVFDASGMMARFREQILKDLGAAGAFRRLATMHYGDDGIWVTDSLEDHVNSTPPCRHDAFVAGALSVCPAFARNLVNRWASVRYYTTPMDFDYCMHELPVEASALMIQADAQSLQHTRPGDYLEAVPEPMRSAIDVMDIGFPTVFNEADARCLIEAVRRTRDAVPEAREKFAAATTDAFAEGMKDELVGLLRDQFRREHLLRKGSMTLSDGFKTALRDGGLEKVVELAAVEYAPIAGGTRAAAAEWLENRRRRKEAPWKTTCEYLRARYDDARRSQLRAILRGARDS